MATMDTMTTMATMATTTATIISTNIYNEHENRFLSFYELDSNKYLFIKGFESLHHEIALEFYGDFISIIIDIDSNIPDLLYEDIKYILHKYHTTQSEYCLTFRIDSHKAFMRNNNRFMVIRHITEIITDLPVIKELTCDFMNYDSIKNPEIINDCLSIIYRVLEYNTVINKLKIVLVSIMGSITQLCKMLKNNNAITRLDLDRCEINDEGANLIIDVLKINRKLTHLQFIRTNIYPELITQIDSALLNNKQLHCNGIVMTL